MLVGNWWLQLLFDCGGCFGFSVVGLIVWWLGFIVGFVCGCTTSGVVYFYIGWFGMWLVICGCLLAWLVLVRCFVGVFVFVCCWFYLDGCVVVVVCLSVTCLE